MDLGRPSPSQRRSAIVELRTRRYESLTLQVVEDLLCGLLRRLLLRIDHQLGVLWSLVRVGDPGELLDLARAGLRVESLDVPPLALLHRGLDIGLDEAAVHLRSRFVPDLPVRRDRRL